LKNRSLCDHIVHCLSSKKTICTLSIYKNLKKSDFEKFIVKDKMGGEHTWQITAYILYCIKSVLVPKKKKK
jgi:hypothetical protein